MNEYKQFPLPSGVDIFTHLEGRIYGSTGKESKYGGKDVTQLIEATSRVMQEIVELWPQRDLKTTTTKLNQISQILSIAKEFIPYFESDMCQIVVEMFAHKELKLPVLTLFAVMTSVHNGYVHCLHAASIIPVIYTSINSPSQGKLVLQIYANMCMRSESARSNFVDTVTRNHIISLAHNREIRGQVYCLFLSLVSLPMENEFYTAMVSMAIELLPAADSRTDDGPIRIYMLAVAYLSEYSQFYEEVSESPLLGTLLEVMTTSDASLLKSCLFILQNIYKYNSIGEVVGFAKLVSLIKESRSAAVVCDTCTTLSAVMASEQFTTDMIIELSLALISRISEARFKIRIHCMRCLRDVVGMWKCIPDGEEEMRWVNVFASMLDSDENREAVLLAIELLTYMYVHNNALIDEPVFADAMQIIDELRESEDVQMSIEAGRFMEMFDH